MSRFAFVLVAVAIAQPVFAQTPATPSATPRFGALRPAQPNPYGKLFDAPPSARSESSKRRVVCGLTIVEGDPKIDPKIFVTNKNDAVDYTLRKIDPPVCKP